jgi:glycosyltransferase involved in cell wall biosynthesis
MLKNLNIAFVGNFYGHGKIYDQWGTSFCILLSELECVKGIDVICPKGDSENGMEFPDKIKIFDVIDYKKKFSVFNIIKSIKRSKYDLVIFNYGPTMYGKSSLMNLLGLFIPIYSNKINKNTVIISQGSSLTNDAENLGYKSLLDKIRLAVLMRLEKILYKKVKSFAQLPMYEKLLKERVKNNRVIGVLKSDYIDAMSTVYMNGYLNKESIERTGDNDKPVILLHGFWGPQKNIELALETLNKIKENGYGFRLILSGGINVHFENYKEYFDKMVFKYNGIIDKYLGYVEEKELLWLFINSDLVLMPYNVPGGQSGVLEMSSFFDNNVICFDFPEFREELKDDGKILLVNKDGFYTAIESFLKNFKDSENIINIRKKIQEAESNIKDFIDKSIVESKIES